MKLFFQLTLSGIYKFFKNPRQRIFFKLALLYGGKQRYKDGKVKFEKFEFHIPDYQSFIWQYKEIFVEEFYKFPCDTSTPLIYDCGSNVGSSCAYFKRLYPNSKIKAFEADPNLVKYLKQNIEKNDLLNIDIIDKAVWIDNNGIELNLEGADGSSIYSSGEKQKIDSIRLKDMLDKETEIDMLKMDIEGAENQVVVDCGESLAKVKNIFIEYHSFIKFPQSLSQILGILEQNNFRYFIRNDAPRNMPFYNKINKGNPSMDLQLNIFGYRYK